MSDNTTLAVGHVVEANTCSTADGVRHTARIAVPDDRGDTFLNSFQVAWPRDAAQDIGIEVRIVVGRLEGE